MPQSAAQALWASGIASLTSGEGGEEQLLQSLRSCVIISPSIALFALQPSLKAVVPVAVDRAIREIISAVVERSGKKQQQRDRERKRQGSNDTERETEADRQRYGDRITTTPLPFWNLFSSSALFHERFLFLLLCCWRSLWMCL